ncbi:MAG: hypothetical protein C5S49_07225 [Candidatus Methanogaster sp.]|nr:MAG: hypothetical protein C5S49_07225 [ANME-2 cluster archaeon]
MRTIVFGAGMLAVLPVLAGAGVDYTTIQTAVGVGFMYGCVPEIEKVYKDTSNT